MKRKPAILGGVPVFENKIPITEPTLPGSNSLREEVDSIIRSRMITNSRFVQEFEEKLEKYLGVRCAIALSSCTSGLMLILRTLEIAGEVIVPSFTFHATCHAIVWNNLKPVFVDCNPETYNIDPAKVEQSITSKTSAILAVHIFGNPCEVDSLRYLAKKYKLRLIFDAAHGLGTKYREKNLGGSGDAESFSLSPTKLMTTGEGGIVTTNDAELAEKIRIGRNYGDSGTYDCDFVGLSARMPEISALLGIKCLEMLEKNVEARNHLAIVYREELSKIPGISFQKIEHKNKSSYKDFSVCINEERFGMDRDILCDALAKENIITKKYFFPAVHRQKVYKKYYDGDKNSLVVTEQLSNNSLSLPLYSHMTEAEIRKISRTIENLRLHSKEIRNITRNIKQDEKEN